MSSPPANRPIRILLGKVGLDGHDRGLLTIARALEQAGMEVIYGGIRKTAKQVAAAAVQEDAEAVGLSSLSGSHLLHFPRVARELRRLGRKPACRLSECGRGPPAQAGAQGTLAQSGAGREILLFCGGIMPPKDERTLRKAGFARIFGPGATLAGIVRFVRSRLRPARAIPLRKLDHIAIAVRQAEPALKLFRDTLGMREAGSEEVPAQKVRTTFLSLGDVHLELVEPTCADSPISRFLAERAGGVHHVAFQTQSVSGALERSHAEGLRPTGQGATTGAQGKRVAFLHPSGTHRLLIELTEKQ